MTKKLSLTSHPGWAIFRSSFKTPSKAQWLRCPALRGFDAHLNLLKLRRAIPRSSGKLDLRL